MFWIGGRAGRGGWPGICATWSSSEISDISTYSRSSNFFTTFVGSKPAGLYGPCPVSPSVRPMAAGGISCPRPGGGTAPVRADEAAAANM